MSGVSSGINIEHTAIAVKSYEAKEGRQQAATF
jgi:hypothetical protein